MAIGASLGTDPARTASLRAAARAGDAQATAAVAREFEAMFVRMMLTAMRETEFDDTFGGGPGAEPYRDWFDARIAEDIAARGEFGLATVFEQQLSGAPQPQITHRLHPRATRDAPAPLAPAHGPSEPRTPATPSVPTRTDDEPAKTALAFVARVVPHAQAAARRLGTPAGVLVAQAALETGWGRKLPRTGDGRPTYNMFGIKADSSWNGARVRVPTIEFESGVAVRRQAEFRAYDSIAASFADYVDFLQSRPAYREALAVAGDPGRYVEALQAAGYATDPAYAEKIRTIMAALPDPQLMLAQRSP
jgi:flagellar protein FlgJ